MMQRKHLPLILAGCLLLDSGAKAYKPSPAWTEIATGIAGATVTTGLARQG